jgi:hypothetical protein
VGSSRALAADQEIPAELRTPASVRTLTDSLRERARESVKTRVVELLRELGVQETEMERVIKNGKDSIANARRNLATCRDNTRRLREEQMRDLELRPQLEQKLEDAKKASDAAFDRWDHVLGRSSASYSESEADRQYVEADQVLSQAEANLEPILVRLETFESKFRSAERLERLAEFAEAAALRAMQRQVEAAEPAVTQARRQLDTVAEEAFGKLPEPLPTNLEDPADET